jgi:hypothetical protein
MMKLFSYQQMHGFEPADGVTGRVKRSRRVTEVSYGGQRSLGDWAESKVKVKVGQRVIGVKGDDVALLPGS